MPRKLSRTKRLVAGIGGALCALAVAPGAALAAECPVPVTTPAFAQFGDANQYVLAPGGNFETLSWATVGSVSLAGVNEPFMLSPGVRSLKLRSSESATSASFCVDRTMPHLRFVAKGEGSLRVTVEVTHPGGVVEASSTSISGDGHESWAPSRFVDLRTSTIPEGESAAATVTFRGNSGWWLIDSVFLDPYRR